MPFSTPEKILNLVAHTHYHVFPDTTTTVCCLVTHSGFTVIGKSACAIPAEFNKELGEQYAREEALKELWDREAYMFKEKIHALDGR